jgi:hypothetical protein
MPVEYLTSAIEDRLAEVLTLLADRGQHRTVLRMGKDLQLIAGITSQPLEQLRTARCRMPAYQASSADDFR